MKGVLLGCGESHANAHLFVMVSCASSSLVLLSPERPCAVPTVHPVGAVTFWLLTAAAAQTRSRIRVVPAECDVDGFVLKKQHLPRSLYSDSSAEVHTLQFEESAGLRQAPKVAATAAACMRNKACVMFTSDGFLLGVRRTAFTVAAFNAAIARERQGGGPLSWVPMQYCAGHCCGTWVATDLQQLLLTPAVGSSSLTPVSAGDLARHLADDSVTVGYREFDAEVMKRFCAASSSVAAVKPAHTHQQCPRHCQVACCAKFANGTMQFDMYTTFEQCAIDVCALGCSLPGNPKAVIGKAPEGPRPEAASATSDVLMRQYLRGGTAQGSPASMGRRGGGAANASGPLN
jgi:hypothetical protein